MDGMAHPKANAEGTPSFPVKKPLTSHDDLILLINKNPDLRARLIAATAAEAQAPNTASGSPDTACDSPVESKDLRPPTSATPVPPQAQASQPQEPLESRTRDTASPSPLAMASGSPATADSAARKREARKALQGLAKVVADMVKNRKFGSANVAPSRHELKAAMDRIASAIEDLPEGIDGTDMIMKAIADGLLDGNADEALTTGARAAAQAHVDFPTWSANLVQQLCAAEVPPPSTTIFAMLAPEVIKLCTASKQSHAESINARHEAYTSALNAMRGLRTTCHKIWADYPSYTSHLEVMFQQLMAAAKGPSSGIELGKNALETMEKFTAYIKQCQSITSHMDLGSPASMARFAGISPAPNPAGNPAQQQQHRDKHHTQPNSPAQQTNQGAKPGSPKTYARYFTYEIAPDGKINSLPVCSHCAGPHFFRECNRQQEPRQKRPVNAITEDQLKAMRAARRQTPGQPPAAPAGKAPPASGNPSPGNQ
jgi:hypothetical protein